MMKLITEASALHARAEPVALYEPHTDLHMHKDSGLYMDSDSHISATACHNMGLIFSPDPFHYLFLTALVHPLSTCAYLLFLSHCNNYILPSHSRQPKLASRFILSSDWGFFLVTPFFPQPACKQACSDACAWAIITQKFTPRYVE